MNLLHLGLGMYLNETNNKMKNTWCRLLHKITMKNQGRFLIFAPLLPHHPHL